MLPSKKQLKYCYDILAVVKEAEADEDGQPLFETSREEADKYIKANRHRMRRQNVAYREENNTPDMFGIPNH